LLRELLNRRVVVKFTISKVLLGVHTTFTLMGGIGYMATRIYGAEAVSSLPSHVMLSSSQRYREL
jgi:hypothetical protein